jgi:alpha-1,2-mannosyltransferase
VRRPNDGGSSRAVLSAAALCLAVACLSFYVWRVDVLRPWHGESDLAVYRGAVAWWFQHRPLYSFRLRGTPYGFTYPPFAAYLMRPWAWLGQTRAMVLNEMASVVALVATTWWLIRPVASRHGWPAWTTLAVAVPSAYFLEPVRETLGLGQVNLYLAALVLLDVEALRRGRRFAGVGIGLATAIKLTPALFIPYLLITGRRRAAGVATGTFLAAAGLAFGLSPSTSVQYWTHTMFQTSRVGPTGAVANQSLLGLLTRLAGAHLPHGIAWAVLGAVLVLGLARARSAHRRGDELVGVVLAGLTACLVSPISWTHHLYWIVPAVLVLVDLAAGTPPAVRAGSRPRRRPEVTAALASIAALVVFLVFASSVVWYFTTPAGSMRGTGPVAVLGADAYVVVMLGLLVLLPARRTGMSPGRRDGHHTARQRAVAEPE